MRPANKGQYHHDGRFATSLNVVNHYNTLFTLGLTELEKGGGTRRCKHHSHSPL
jgi:hypothetical protein